MAKDKLTAKQRNFVNEYLTDLNATQAAIRAGYSEKSAFSIGVENLRKPLIAQAIAAAQRDREARTQIDADWLLSRFAEEVTADIADLYSPEGSLLPIHQWPLIWRQGLVAGVDVQQQYRYEDGEQVPDGIITKVKLSDRVKRLELIGKHINVGAFAEKIQISGEIDLVDRLQRARQRLNQHDEKRTETRH